MQDSMLIIGGGRWQLALVHAARAAGYRTIVTDRDPNAPCAAIADRFHPIAMHRLDALAELAKSERVSLVLSDQTDRAVPVIAALNEQLNLPGIRPDVAARFTDKALMREALRNSSVIQPRWRIVLSVAELETAVSELGFPFIIKPPISQASRGVLCVMDRTELRAAIANRFTSAANPLLIEEWIDGLEVTVEGICIDGTHHVLAISEKSHYAHQPCVACRLRFPARLSSRIGCAVRHAVNEAVRTLGLRDGLTHAEFRIRAEKPHLIEIAARGCGNDVASVLVPHVTGIDTYALLIRRLRGEAVTIFPCRSRGEAALLEFFQFTPGLVRSITGLDDVVRNRLADVIELPFRPGSAIPAITDDTARPGFFMILGSNAEEVEQQAVQVRSAVRVEYESEPMAHAVSLA